MKAPVRPPVGPKTDDGTDGISGRGSAEQTQWPLTCFHWGTYRAETHEGKLVRLHPFEEDVDPSPIGQGIVDALDAPSRITAPMVRKGWLENGPRLTTNRRGEEPFVQVSWETAEELVAGELDRIRNRFGNEAIFAGSYGWASAGRFHHAQGHLKRFLNCMGGFVRSVNSYSLAAGEVIVDHVLGNYRDMIYNQTSWSSIVQHTELFVAFGGMPLRNAQIGQGGVGRHRQREAMRQARAAGVEFVNISPIRSDVTEEIDPQWIAARPGSDVALMLGLAHTLLAEDLHDRAFLQRYTVGFEQLAAYLRGETDGTVKSAQWASGICGIPADDITNLARRMARSRTMLSASWSLTRQDNGEQPFWMLIALAAMLGQIGLPGGGFGLGYAAVNNIGLERQRLSFAPLSQGENPVSTFIPVARIADMLESPGEGFEYNGQSLTYPDIRMIYWAGGNPFHHHQDLNRLRKAWSRPETIIAHEWNWNALARHADIVLPCTTPVERTDLSLNPRDPYLVAMQQVTAPPEQARDDFEIFRALARRLDFEESYTNGWSADEWLHHLYAASRQSASRNGVTLPDLDTLQKQGWHRIAPPEKPYVLMEDFRADPDASPLLTPSGRIELFSDTIAKFGYEDCPGHPCWSEPVEWLGGDTSRHPLHMISNQPTTKLHSQLDQGETSRRDKIAGRETVTLNPGDAATRGLSAGDIVRVFNDRGACLCAVIIDDSIMPGVVQISTGAWFDPDLSDPETNLCKHGNPNVLTLDRGTSRLAQGPVAHSCLVEVEKRTGPAPEVTAFLPPDIEPC